MQNRSRQTIGVGQPDAPHHIADLGNDDIGQHPAHIPLGQGQSRSTEDSSGRHPDDARLHHRMLEKGVSRGKYRKNDPDHQVNRHLGHQGGNEQTGPRRRQGISLRQPAMQREESHLHPQTDQHEGKGGGQGRALLHGAKDTGDVGHVQRAGENVEITHPQQVKTGADAPHDDVVEAG